MKKLVFLAVITLTGCLELDPCPGALTCADGVCCPEGYPYHCNGQCWNDPSACAGGGTVCEANGGSDDGDDATGPQSWSLALAGGFPLQPGYPEEIADITVRPGLVGSGTWDQVGGQWYVIDRLGNVVDIRFTAQSVSNVWSFTGSGGPSPDGMFVQLNASGYSNAASPAFTEASGQVTLTLMQNGLPAVGQAAEWYAWRN
jgi:hypothetical protein